MGVPGKFSSKGIFHCMKCDTYFEVNDVSQKTEDPVYFPYCPYCKCNEKFIKQVPEDSAPKVINRR